MTSLVLTTQRLTLTPVAVPDFGEIAALWAHETFTRAIAGRAPLNEEEVWLRLLRDVGHWSALGRGNWTIRHKSSGDYVGSVGVLDYRRACYPALDAPELGWGVAPRFQSQGLAREAVDAALHWCDRVMGVPRTQCLIDPLNSPSLKLAERVGYRHREEARYQDEDVLLLERLAPHS